jgi:NADPH-dependent 7-cyano-7-deazaguanine reductase QueF-like protein
LFLGLGGTVIGKYKKFDKKLYDLYDESAKQAVCRYLARHGHEVCIPDEDYGADLYHIRKDGVKVWHEVEISKVWWGSDGKPSAPHTSIPERKIKLVEEKEYPHLLHWLLNIERDRAIVCNMKVHMKDEYLVPFGNKYIAEGEYFYQIPLKLCKIVRLDK